MHQQRTILIASATTDLREHHARHLDADAHTIHSAEDTASLTARLTAHAIDIVVLAELERPAVSLAVLRQLRAGQLHARVHPAQPVITLDTTDNLATLHAYDAGSDHHLPADVDYLILRTVIDAITRRTTDTITSRHRHVGTLHIDHAARTIDIAGKPVRVVSRLEFDLLAKLAESREAIIELIAATTTTTGLKIYAQLDDREYDKGVTVSDEQMATVNLRDARFTGNGTTP